MTAIPIVALDLPSTRDALALVERLGDECRFYKVGSELFTREGPAVVQALRDAGCDVFLDLKFHDIPNTVRQGAAAAASLGARLLTVHASGGEAMVRAAVEGAGEGCGVLAVTILTSLDAGMLARAWGRDTVSIDDEVLRLAGVAATAGAHGIVCSGRELAAVRTRFGDRLAPLVPGIRLAGGASHDQARTMGPGEAARAGARYLVLGRAVTAAADPVAAMHAVRRELGEA
ncbi:MAG TPA: orotidine-5'-phosphate decarboxylase [Gemmatimonadaceae bacterium]